MVKLRFRLYQALYDSASLKADIADGAAFAVSSVDKASDALRYRGACEVWLSLADLARSLDALGVPPSYVRKEVEDMVSVLSRHFGKFSDERSEA